ncbi:hypothetical protein N665_0137s0051 [Sinapis alba]|nr:hypothetical protein N665_0137s0051 [Sinapis alba]
MLRRQRPGGGRHPPPLTPTVSNFKPRAQWNNSGSSILLYVNLPGFYKDQIEIKKDEKTRTIYIQGQRPLSTHTKARFNEVYRVPESCDMTKLNTSFSHGLLTIEFPVVVEGDKTEKAGNDQGTTVQRLDNEESRGSSLSGSSLGRKKPLDKEKQVGTIQEKAAPLTSKEEPKTYKSVVEGKRVVPTANQVKAEQKVASPSLGSKEHVKQETVVEKKEAVKIGQQKTVQKAKEEEARSASTVDGSLKAKVVTKEEKEIERKKNIGQKVKEEGKIGLGEKKEENSTKQAVGDEAQRTNKEISATNQAKPELKTKEKVERITHEGNGNVISKHDKKDEKMLGYKVSEGEIQERVEEKKVEEAGLVMEPRRVDSDVKVDLTKGGEEREKIVKKISKSERVTLLVEEERKTIMDTHATEGRGHESQVYDTSLVNVGVASLVIMGFGAYVFVPLVKMFY